MAGHVSFCPSCGASLRSEAVYCEQCGQVRECTDAGMRELSWDANIPAFDLLKGAGRVLLIAFGITFIIIEIISQFTGHSFTYAITQSIVRNDPYIYYAGGFVGFWLLLSAIAIWAVYRGGYEATFGVEKRGIWMETRPGTRKKNKIINFLLFWLALFSGRPGGMGTALLANASQSAAYEWEDVCRIIPNPERCIITLKSNWRTLIQLYCTPQNYAEVLGLVEEYVRQSEPQRAARAKNSLAAGDYARLLLRPLAVGIGAALVWQSPLLPEKTGVGILAVTALAGCVTGGRLRRNTAYMTGAVLLGLAIAMAINAYEPMGDYYFRYYRYFRLERMPYIAEFGVSIAGMAILAIMAWRNTKI